MLLLRRFPSNRRGAAAVEFALVASLLLVTILFVMTVAMILFITQSIDYATTRASRQIMTGAAQATNAVTVNAGKVPFAQVQLQTPLISRTGQTITSSATIKNNFGQIFRTPTTTIGNTVTASADLPSDLDFFPPARRVRLHGPAGHEQRHDAACGQ